MKIMKRKMAVFAMFFAFLLCVLGICVGAQESIYSENIREINNGVYTLSGVMDGYAEADTSEEKAVAIRTNAVILNYVNTINALRADSRVSSEDLSAEVMLLSAKGVVAGECAWIFESHSGELSVDARARVVRIYEGTQEQIEDCLSIEILRGDADSYVRGVLIAVYEEKLAAICTPEDTASVRSIADAAKGELRALGSTDHADYDRIFLRALGEVQRQRAKELAISRFAAAYEKINGQGSFERDAEMDENIGYFLYLASEADTADAFNSAIEDSILSVLEVRLGDAQCEYTRALFEDVARSLSVLRSDADGLCEIFDAGAAFENISMRISVAEKKDALALYAKDVLGDALSSRAQGLLEEYNAAGGIFEECADERLAEFSLKQARLRVDWCAECERYIRLSEGFFEEPYEEVALRFDELYFAVDSEMAEALTLEKTRDTLRLGRESAGTLCFELEAEAYLLRVSDVTQKSAADVTRADVPRLREAILEYDVLGAQAQEIIEAEIASICKKYKAAIADYLYYISVGDGDARIAREYSGLIEQTAFSGDAECFVGYCEVLCKKAESEMRICGIYKELAARDGYSAFADNYKNAIRECREVYLLRVKDMPMDRVAADAELDAVIRSAELEMLRRYTEAVIASFATDADSDEVGVIISSALSELRFADSTTELEEAMARAELDVYRQRAKEELSALKIRTDGALELLKYISSGRLSEYRAELTASLNGALYALNESSELAAVKETLEEYRAQMLTLYGTATAEDLERAKICASETVEAQSAEEISNIEGMKYISDADRARLVAAVIAARDLARQSAELSASVRDVESIVNANAAELAGIRAEAERCELASAVEKCREIANSQAVSAIGAIDALSYIPTARAESIKAEISQRFDALSSGLERTTCVSDAEACLDEFLSSLSERVRSVIAEDLELAIEKYSREISAIRADFAARIAEARYLEGARLSEYSARASELCGAALSRLEAAEDAHHAESIWHSVDEAMEELCASLARDELAAARGAVLAALEGASDASLARISALEYLSDSRKAQIAIEADALCAEFSSLLQSDPTPAAAEARLAEYNQKIKALEERAEGESVAGARADYTAALGLEFSAYKNTDYTAERYAQIADVYDVARRAISEAGDVRSIENAFATAKRAMAEVVSIFEDRKSELSEKVKDAYAELLKMSAQYSEKSRSSLTQIKDDALAALAAAPSTIGLGALAEIAEDAVGAMRAVNLDWISSGKIGSESSGFAEYPAGYDHSVGGIWGIVESTDGLPSDLRLSIFLTDGNKLYKKALREALAGERIAYVGELPMSNAEIRERLEGLEIKGVFSVKLIRAAAIYDEFSGEYTVRMLLPASMRAERTLRVVYISPDGDAEYYDAVCEDGMLVFKTTHFSDFVVLGERRVNLLPIIALLSFLGGVEVLILIATRAWIKREKERLIAVSPLPFAAFYVIAPRGGAIILPLLLAADVTLAALIFIDLRTLRKERREMRSARVYALPVDFEDNTDESALAGAEKERVAMLPAYLDRVSAEDADSLISDSKATSLIIRSEIAPRVCRGCKKTFVNADTLSESFERGETVTINRLKERGLVPMSACYVKVLARGVIDKPLTVRAQSFSANAVKMIALTGGTAILEGSDVES